VGTSMRFTVCLIIAAAMVMIVVARAQDIHACFAWTAASTNDLPTRCSSLRVLGGGELVAYSVIYVPFSSIDSSHHRRSRY
jgi:hypothetical protein